MHTKSQKKARYEGHARYSHDFGWKESFWTRMANVNDNNAVNGDHARATGERILFSMSVCGLWGNYVTRKYTNSIVVFLWLWPRAMKKSPRRIWHNSSLLIPIFHGHAFAFTFSLFHYLVGTPLGYNSELLPMSEAGSWAVTVNSGSLVSCSRWYRKLHVSRFSPGFSTVEGY